MDDSEGFEVPVAWLFVNHHVDDMGPAAEIKAMGGGRGGETVDELENACGLLGKGEFVSRRNGVEFVGAIVMGSDESSVDAEMPAGRRGTGGFAPLPEGCKEIRKGDCSGPRGMLVGRITEDVQDSLCLDKGVIGQVNGSARGSDEGVVVIGGVELVEGIDGEGGALWLCEVFPVACQNDAFKVVLVGDCGNFSIHEGGDGGKWCVIGGVETVVDAFPHV